MWSQGGGVDLNKLCKGPLDGVVYQIYNRTIGPKALTWEDSTGVTSFMPDSLKEKNMFLSYSFQKKCGSLRQGHIWQYMLK